MKVNRLEEINREIQSIKSQLQDIETMRPGSLTKQYRNRKEQTGAYYQISYTHQMKSKTEYVRREFVEKVQQQIAVYKRFKDLTDRWIALGIEYSQLEMKLEIEKGKSKR